MILQFNQLQQAIEGADDILFVCHQNPDPDTIGSALALGGYINSFGKKAKYFCKDKLTDNFLFLKGAKEFSQNIDLFSEDNDLVIFVDCSELSRCGVEKVLDYKNQFWVNIDHHTDKERVADLTIRDADAVAACEIVFGFLQHAGFFVDTNTATALLAGVLIDTNFLSNSATKGESVAIAGELSGLGADYRNILKSFCFNKNQEILKVWGMALSRLKYNKEKDLTTTAILRDDINEDKNLNEAMDGFSNFLNAILKSNVVMVLSEYDNKIRGSIRTCREDIDVTKIAEQYGGGGHQKAAGFMCEGKLAEGEDEWKIDPAVEL